MSIEDTVRLGPENTPSHPCELFEIWLKEAHAVVREANAMTLALADADGRPSARQVLLKHVDDGGFVFFSNYRSAKARALAANPRAALVFWWEPLARQVRVEGRVERTSAEESDAYFASRPRESQIGAWASPQSEEIGGREFLLAEFERYRQRFGDGPIPRPPHWGGYRVVPDRVEFWQGVPYRLHERLVYLREGEGWSKKVLAP